MLLLLDTRNDKHYVGDNSVEVLAASGAARFDFGARRILVRNIDTLSYSDQYTPDEFLRTGSQDAIRHLCRDHGFLVFRSIN